MVGRDRNIPYHRVMLQIKNNLAPEGKAYVFELNPDYGFRWIGQDEYEVEDILVRKPRMDSKLDKAKDYLRLLLNGTDMACADILDKMRANGIGKRTVEQAKKDMESMLDYIDKLNELDTEGVEPLSHVFPVHNVFREDEVTNGDDRENMLKNAPQKKEGTYMVPKTFA